MDFCNFLFIFVLFFTQIKLSKRLNIKFYWKLKYFVVRKNHELKHVFEIKKKTIKDH